MSRPKTTRTRATRVEPIDVHWLDLWYAAPEEMRWIYRQFLAKAFVWPHLRRQGHGGAKELRIAKTLLAGPLDGRRQPRRRVVQRRGVQ